MHSFLVNGIIKDENVHKHRKKTSRCVAKLNIYTRRINKNNSYYSETMVTTWFSYAMNHGYQYAKINYGYYAFTTIKLYYLFS